MKPGELRILYALARNGPLRSEDLKIEASLVNPNVRSGYLKNLLKLGLITRSLDDRRFSIISFGWEFLYLTDIKKFIEKRISLIEATPLLNPRPVALWQMLDNIDWESGIQRLKRSGIYLDEKQPFVLMTEMKQHEYDLDSLDLTKPFEIIKEMFKKVTGEEFYQLPDCVLIFHNGLHANMIKAGARASVSMILQSILKKSS